MGNMGIPSRREYRVSGHRVAAISQIDGAHALDLSIRERIAVRRMFPKLIPGKTEDP